MKGLLSLLLLLPLLAHAEINFIALKHRNAEALLPLLRPVVDEGIKLNGKGPTLIVNSLPWQLTEIRQLVQELDTPLQSLLISVRQGGGHQARVIHGDVEIGEKKPEVRIYGTNKNKRHQVSQQLRIIEGEWATIRAGEEIPVVTQTYSPASGTTQQSIEYKSVDSGFDVRALLHGNRVTLNIRPFRSRPSLSGGGIVNHQEIVTSLNGELGEWIYLGGAGESSQYNGSGTVYTTGKSQHLIQNVSVMVERLSPQ